MGLGIATSLCDAAAAEPLELEDLSGGRVSVALGPGERALVVHFWATWCPSCADELPVVARAAELCKGRGVRIRIAAAGETAPTVGAYLRAHGFAFASLIDPRGRAWRSAGGYGLPTNWIRTERGDRLLTGPRSSAEWRELLGDLGCNVAL